MKEFQSYSQAGQDRFAFELIGRRGTFLDIGANHPRDNSNSYGLELMGWEGWLVERDVNACSMLRAARQYPVIEGDSSTMNYSWLPAADYLSLDVDQSSISTLKRLFSFPVRFKVITLEHDDYAYKDGPSPRCEMIDILTKAGYDVLCSEVCDKGMSFEIWAVDPLEVDAAKAEKFRRNQPTDWKEFWK